MSVTVSTTDEDWRSLKQLGSLMGTPENIRRRMQQTAIAFRRMYSLWLLEDNVSIYGSVCFYQAFVLLELLYYCCTRGGTEACTDRLDDFHRRHLRSLNGHYRLASPPTNQIVIFKQKMNVNNANARSIKVMLWEATI